MKILYPNSKSILLLAIYLLLNFGAKSQINDTINVQTFTFGSSQDSFFIFPPDTNRYEKILMNYTLKCNPALTPYHCGQWDYLSYTDLYQHTHTYDSTLLTAPSYIVDGNSPDSIQYMISPSYSYFPHWQTHIVYDNIISVDSSTIGTGSMISNHPFNSNFPQSRTQYLWKASELTTAGLHAGNITNLRLNLQSLGSQLNGLTIRLKNSTLDSLTPAIHETTGLSTALTADISFASTGWNVFNLTYPFHWDGTSNLVIDISYTNSNAGTDNTIGSDSTNFSSGIYSSGDDRSLFFTGTDQVDVPNNVFASLDSFFTVTFWCYGNPAVQPQNNSAFEAEDSLGRRVLNVHMPWSDGNVYFDCGNSESGSYDRINAAVASTGWEGQWNYWTFTKNVSTGIMRAYLNGHLLFSGTTKTRTMAGIRKFYFGSGASDDYYYGGNLDEFAVWNKDLDSTTIKAYMFKDLDASHPYNSNLILYYHCNDNSFTTAADASTLGGDNGTLLGIPSDPQITGPALFRNFNPTNGRPYIVFSQDSFTSHLDSTYTIDSVEDTPFQIVQYNDFAHPTTPTDTLLVWGTYYNNYTYDSVGHATDSSAVAADTTLHLIQTHYYSAPFEVVIPYEIGRFITPYGINLSLGNGFTWTYDVSDYATLLHDTVYLSGGNWQELLDVSFEMIKGIPPRDPISIVNLWNGNYAYDGIQNTLSALTVKIDSNALNTRYKMTTTGHGFGDNVTNCSEFCPRHHFLSVNNIQEYDTLVWRNSCSSNPVYPQGGTWIYNRSNWCPGAPAGTYDFELTPYVTPGDSVNLHYTVDPFTWNGGGTQPYYAIATQLVSYSAPNFTLDAGVWDIVSPSSTQIYSRVNPICSNPEIIIKNCGKDTLKSLTIVYGIEGGPQSSYNWTGNLPFTQMQHVILPPFNWSSGNKFIATVVNPNGGVDEYGPNNSMTTTYSMPPQYPSTLIFDLLTDYEYAEYGYPEGSYTITDDQGNIIWQRSNLNPSTTYKDTLNLANGCYFFHFIDQLPYTDWTDPNYNEGDGMTAWPDTNNIDGHMNIRKANGAILKSFNMDFGHELFQQFTVGYYLDVPNIPVPDVLSIYPNPSKGIYNLDMSFSQAQDVSVVVYDMMGNKIYDQLIKNATVQINKIDLSNQPDGIYFITAQTKDKRISRKLIKNN